MKRPQGCADSGLRDMWPCVSGGTESDELHSGVNVWLDVVGGEG